MEVPDAERAVGIEVYATAGPPCAALARSSNEDFLVEELMDGLKVAKEARPGYYPLYRVVKRSIDTMHMEREMADELKSRVSYGGLKDKNAVALQYVTPTSRRSRAPDVVARGGFSARLIGWVARPLSHGSVSANRFEVTLRHCCSAISERAEEAFALAEAGRLPNFFGHQRFGTRGAKTHAIGRAIVRREFQEAVELMLSAGGLASGSGLGLADDRIGTGAGDPLPQYDVEGMVANRLSKRPRDWVWALRAVPIRLRRLYTQAYQSFLFNRTLSLAMSKGLDISKVERGDNWCEASADGFGLSAVRGAKEPPPGNAVPMVQLSGYSYRGYGSRFDACADEVMTDERVSPRDFYIQEMQEVSVEGGFRRGHLGVKDASVSASEGGAVLKFSLARGGYATILLREIIKPRDPAMSGLA